MPEGFELIENASMGTRIYKGYKGAKAVYKGEKAVHAANETHEHLTSSTEHFGKKELGDTVVKVLNGVNSAKESIESAVEHFGEPIARTAGAVWEEWGGSKVAKAAVKGAEYLADKGATKLISRTAEMVGEHFSEEIKVAKIALAFGEKWGGKALEFATEKAPVIGAVATELEAGWDGIKAGNALLHGNKNDAKFYGAQAAIRGIGGAVSIGAELGGAALDATVVGAAPGIALGVAGIGAVVVSNEVADQMEEMRKEGKTYDGMSTVKEASHGAWEEKKHQAHEVLEFSKEHAGVLLSMIDPVTGLAMAANAATHGKLFEGAEHMGEKAGHALSHGAHRAVDAVEGLNNLKDRAELKAINFVGQETIKGAVALMQGEQKVSSRAAEVVHSVGHSLETGISEMKNKFLGTFLAGASHSNAITAGNNGQTPQHGIAHA